jgi:hypothetical protein
VPAGELAPAPPVDRPLAPAIDARPAIELAIAPADPPLEPAVDGPLPAVEPTLEPAFIDPALEPAVDLRRLADDVLSMLFNAALERLVDASESTVSASADEFSVHPSIASAVNTPQTVAMMRVRETT